MDPSHEVGCRADGITTYHNYRPLSCAASLCRQSSAIRLCCYNNREVRFTRTHVSMARSHGLKNGYIPCTSPVDFEILIFMSAAPDHK